MRVLTVAPGPDFSVQDVHMGWTKGLAKAGVTVREFNLNKRLELWTRAQIDGTNLFNFDAALDITKEGLYGQLWAFDPDVVVITSGFFTEPEMIDRLLESVLIDHCCPQYGGFLCLRCGHANRQHK